jgi:hypothetical protein
LTHIFGCSDIVKRDFMDRYEKALDPFTKGRGIDWEVQVEECDVSLVRCLAHLRV